MDFLPSAVVFVNDDLVQQTINHLIIQLHLHEVIDGDVFDARIAANPNYVQDVVKANGLRIMVKRPFTELENRTEADVAIFIKHAMASVLKNNFGPPGQTVALLNIYWQRICVFDV